MVISQFLSPAAPLPAPLPRRRRWLLLLPLALLGAGLAHGLLDGRATTPPRPGPRRYPPAYRRPKPG